jgi:hypothetical protein
VHSPGNCITDLICLDDPKGMPDPQKTFFYFWYDEDALFADIICEIDSTFEKGTFGPRDYSVDADFLRIQLATCPGDKFLYIFHAFPLGNLRDGARTGLNDLNYDWNSHFSYTCDFSDSTWTTHMRIPFRDLRIQGKPPYHWAINVLRSYTKREPDQQFGYPMVDTDHTWGDYIDHLEPIVIENPVHKAHNYRIEPYLTRTYDLKEKTSSYDPDHVGLNLEYRPAGTVSVKAAFNPDFAEVPEDDETDTSNLQYARYLDENRFFFIEDLDAFGVSDGYLYTRSIAQPQYAVKVTGNTKHLTYAVLNALDKESINEWGETENSADLYTVVGLRPHTKNHSLQFDIMNRYNHDEERNASTLYICEKSEIGTHHSFSTDLYLTDDSRPDRERHQGTRFEIKDYLHYGDHTMGLSWYIVSKRFAPAIASPGSDENNGFHNSNIWYEFNHYNYTGWLERSHASLSMYCLDYYYDNKYPDLGMNTNGNISIRPDWWFSGNGGYYRDTQQGVQSTGYNVSGSFGNTTLDWLRPNFSYGVSKSWNYSLRHRYMLSSVNPSIEGTVDPYLNYSLAITNYKWHDLPDSVQFDNEYNIGNFNLTVNASQRIFLTAGVRYRDTDYRYYDGSGILAWHLHGHVGSFVTLRYDYSETYRFFLGYNGVVEEWNDNYEEQSKTAWFKVNAFF